MCSFNLKKEKKMICKFKFCDQIFGQEMQNKREVTATRPCHSTHEIPCDGNEPSEKCSLLPKRMFHVRLAYFRRSWPAVRFHAVTSSGNFVQGRITVCATLHFKNDYDVNVDCELFPNNLS